MNLTAITEPLKVCELHFLDSAALLPLYDLKGKSLIDVGTGAGFPGIVLKILEPSIHLTLLDSLKKRLDWLSALCHELELSDVKLLHGRAEEYSHDPQYRGFFDVATARAVASLPMLCELCLPYVRAGGTFLAMKTGNDPNELSSAEEITSILGGGATQCFDYTLPLTKTPRRLLAISKEMPTPSGYPRKWSKIKQAKI
jgi:16S rRNA (guanine527-N7)-methyltransferase